MISSFQFLYGHNTHVYGIAGGQVIIMIYTCNMYTSQAGVQNETSQQSI